MQINVKLNTLWKKQTHTQIVHTMLLLRTNMAIAIQTTLLYRITNTIYDKKHNSILFKMMTIGWPVHSSHICELKRIAFH